MTTLTRSAEWVNKPTVLYVLGYVPYQVNRDPFVRGPIPCARLNKAVWPYQYSTVNGYEGKVQSSLVVPPLLLASPYHDAWT